MLSFLRQFKLLCLDRYFEQTDILLTEAFFYPIMVSISVCYYLHEIYKKPRKMDKLNRGCPPRSSKHMDDEANSPVSRNTPYSIDVRTAAPFRVVPKYSR